MKNPRWSSDRGRQIRDGGITSSGGDWGNSYPEAQDPRRAENCRTQISVLFGMIPCWGCCVLKKKAAVLSVYLNIYWRLQNKPLFIWYIWYICIKFCFTFLKELYYPNLGRDFEDFQRRNVSGFLLKQLVSWNVARRWVVKSYYIFSVRFSSPLPTHLNRNNVLLKPY